MVKALILQGLPASGKSTWAKEYCKKNKDWVRVNRDDLREMRGEYWLPKQEDLITAWERAFIAEAAKLGKSIIVDSTNLNPKFLVGLKDYLKSLDIEYSTKLFEVDLEECIRRDSARERSVGELVIRRMWNDYFKPKVEAKPEAEYDPKKPRCFVFDLDGTLSLMKDKEGNFTRDPYSIDVENDAPNENIIMILDSLIYDRGEGLSDVRFVFCSGRKESAREGSERWLRKHTAIQNPIELYMRPDNDFRKDSILKVEIYKNHILPKYNVIAVFDDRSQVVQALREELGLTVLQVSEDNF